MLVDGTVHGDKDRTVENARSLSEAGPGEVTFIEQERTLKGLNDCRASVLVLPVELVGKFPAAERSRFTLIEAKDPLLAFVRIF
ncbi:MAG: LpxD N-terminal domain-containing protein, partial [Gemmataceae bacterium]